MFKKDEEFSPDNLQKGEVFLTGEDADKWLDESGILVLSDHILMSRCDGSRQSMYGETAEKALREAGITLYNNGVKLSEFNGIVRNSNMFNETALI